MESANTNIHERFEAQQQTLADIIETQSSIQAVLEERGVEGSIGDLGDLAEARQLAADRVSKGYESVLTALQRALTQEALSKEESLALFRSSRRKLLVREKLAVMAHVPCTTSARGFVQQAEEHPFTTRATESDEFVEVLLFFEAAHQILVTPDTVRCKVKSSWNACSTAGEPLERWGTILSEAYSYIRGVGSLSIALKLGLHICRARAVGSHLMKRMASTLHSNQHLHSISQT